MNDVYTQEYSYYITDTLLGEEAILGENNPPSTTATGLGVGVSATEKNTKTFYYIKIHTMMCKFL